MIAFTQQVAIQNAEFGIRANVPGLIDTPMAVDTRARVSGKSRAEVAAASDARVPLRHNVGTPWDVANAALFLASDEANLITGVALPVEAFSDVRLFAIICDPSRKPKRAPQAFRRCAKTY
jgi:NAD(P)-dependent dehydrogenase (short-subunit alcohol dehydrogenase family)